jgi:hypothetical protein
MHEEVLSTPGPEDGFVGGVLGFGCKHTAVILLVYF